MWKHLLDCQAHAKWGGVLVINGRQAFYCPVAVTERQVVTARLCVSLSPASIIRDVFTFVSIWRILLLHFNPQMVLD